jgi:hypothetical protein
MALVSTPARLKLLRACDQQHSSRVVTFLAFDAVNHAATLKVAKEEVLLDRLTQVLCACVQHYVDEVQARIDPVYFVGIDLKKSGPFYVDDALCVALNNLTEVRLKVAMLFDFLDLDRVAEAHISLLREDHMNNVRTAARLVSPHPALLAFEDTFAKIDNYRVQCSSLPSSQAPMATDCLHSLVGVQCSSLSSSQSTP